MEDTVPQHMDLDLDQQQNQQQQQSPNATAAAARRGSQSEGSQDRRGEDVPSPGRLDEFDFERSLDAITTACPPASTGAMQDGDGYPADIADSARVAEEEEGGADEKGDEVRPSSYAAYFHLFVIHIFHRFAHRRFRTYVMPLRRQRFSNLRA